jgi:hypothetical protein
MISGAFVGLQPLIDQAVLQADGLCHVLFYNNNLVVDGFLESVMTFAKSF